MSIKDKTISGFFWSFLDRGASQLIMFIVGIVLARLLSPREFGLIGMLMVFITISNALMQSGFNQALIRKKDCTEKDYSTVFYFNLGSSTLIYGILILTSGYISSFYNEPVLDNLIKVLGVGIIINAFTIVQRTKIIKDIDFKLLTKITITSSIASGVVGISFAYLGYGVWSLVYKTVSKFFFEGILLWTFNHWIPKEKFDSSSFKELWGFGSRIMFLGIINAIHKEIYQVVIGKFYPAQQLGQFNRAESFKRLPEQNLSQVIERVTLPVMSHIQDDPLKLKASYRKLIVSTFIIASFLMIVVSAISIELVVLVIGEKWYLAGEYLQILSISSIFYPLSSVNQNILKTKGEANRLLYIGTSMKILTVPLVFIVIYAGIKYMLYAMILYKIIGYLITAYYGGNLIGYGVIRQLKDFVPTSIVCGLVYLSIYATKYFIDINPYVDILIFIFVSIVIFIVSMELLKTDGYQYLKNMVLSKIFKLKK